MRSVGTVLALVVPATVVAIFARRWRTPAPSLLVVAGRAVALLPGAPEIGSCRSWRPHRAWSSTGSAAVSTRAGRCPRPPGRGQRQRRARPARRPGPPPTARDLMPVETARLQRLYAEHAISGTTRRCLQRSLDLEEARLADA
ncbi:hypothetical protein [Streptomyces brasiliensis]|uniref:Uncharacterized protein n=1 Tax=Streptomyces brasiliensis TaxID=1954 RepID=A0A917LAP0_9ACTN|nr:hypothetical protein [Streptomyces brasiliensis]GGJ56841.1 hypothetical protein GCM10010121_079420 [Streptomyces brasiliensis]